MTEISGCPFCQRSKELDVCQDGMFFFVVCSCDATGPSKRTPEAAIEAWNQVAGMKEEIYHLELLVNTFREAWKRDRHYICETGRLFWGDNKQCYAPDAVYRKVAEIRKALERISTHAIDGIDKAEAMRQIAKQALKGGQ